MIEIFGENLADAFKELGIAAVKTYQSECAEAYIKPEVWEISETDFNRLCDIKDTDWKDSWGWWRNGRCILEGSIESEYSVNGKKMFGYRDQRIGDMLEDVVKDDEEGRCRVYRKLHQRIQKSKVSVLYPLAL